MNAGYGGSGMGDGMYRGNGGWTSQNGAEAFGEEERNLDITNRVDVSFEEAAFGCDRTLHLKDGKGKTNSIQVHIPAGIDEGKKVRLKGKGRKQGNRTGDLFLEVHILPKAGYERKGKDVYVTADIPFTTAVFGGEEVVPTLHGNVLCRIPSGTQSGSKIRLKGKGITPAGTSECGDEYVVIRIEVPKVLSPRQEKALREFAEASK